MTEKSFYFDASIWLDIYEKRGANGEKAKTLLRKIIKEESRVCYSDLIIAELKRLGYAHEEIQVILSIAKPSSLKRLHIYKEQIDESIRLAKQRNIPKADALHAILARDSDTQLISRDKDFEKIKEITKAKLPEEFI